MALVSLLAYGRLIGVVDWSNEPMSFTAAA